MDPLGDFRPVIIRALLGRKRSIVGRSGSLLFGEQLKGAARFGELKKEKIFFVWRAVKARCALWAWQAGKRGIFFAFLFGEQSKRAARFGPGKLEKGGFFLRFCLESSQSRFEQSKVKARWHAARFGTGKLKKGGIFFAFLFVKQ